VANGKIVSIDSNKVSCGICNVASLVLPEFLGTKELEMFESVVNHCNPVHRGDYIFHAGDPFHSIYAIKSGSIKTYTRKEAGNNQITGFYLPGELIGLDAIEEGIHHCSAKALETAAVCEIPFDRLEELSSSLPSLQRQMYRLLSKEIFQESNLLTLLGSKNAEERLAGFLLDFSSRFEKRGFSPTDFHLSMSRNDIGSYLGLAVETVSRLFTRFHDDGLLHVERKHVQLKDMDRLKQLFNGGGNNRGREQHS
jgi:CRP/FNR family transcriptional regulator, anaerobic regulatory protein